MSYGKGKTAKTHEFRALPLEVGELSASKRDALAELRRLCLTTLQRMGEVAHCAEPLRGTASDEELTRRLLSEQQATPLNTVYAERCRIAVAAAVSEQNSRYFQLLIGRLHHAAGEIPEADRKPDASGLVRHYFYVPPDQAITPEELADLVARSALPFADIVALFRRVVLDKDNTGVTAAQAAVLQEMHRQVHEKHGKALFGAETTTVSLPLQYQALPKEDKNIAARVDASLDALVLVDKNNAKYKFFLALSSPQPHGKRIRVPVTASKRILGRLMRKNRKDFEANSFTLELGPNGAIGMRLVITQPKTPPTPLTEVKYLLSRDFGYRNTIALTLSKLSVPLDAEDIETIRSFTKEQSKAFLESHSLQSEPEIASRWLFSGKPFLDRINTLAEKIDKLRSRIDLEYQTLFAEKVQLGEALGLKADAEGFLPRIEKGDVPRGHALYDRMQGFLAQLGRINSLKIECRKLYKKIGDVKRHWFGFLSNIEAQTAVTWQAMVVREDLTNEAEEKGSPGYKGRTFNKMINHGSRGQYARRASAKFQWNGVPEVALPSYYTSTTCVRHALVSKKQRKGDWFACPRCREEGRPREHADAHAADMLGAYLLLRPIFNVTPTAS